MFLQYYVIPLVWVGTKSSLQRLTKRRSVSETVRLTLIQERTSRDGTKEVPMHRDNDFSPKTEILQYY